ncbi:carboxypeptidase regulatory-like domain-containing protein [Corallococcus aberystwythensis]|uniref:Carboxypeptidase regulatory-like domain-containing protein n=1 Tax=Corallococcus aberystwythensis TaxID=2316722 RepID=A0A3A8QTQ4_9BACT|nr:carboxypeptidase regulatory-like domain-containing protein [Corallococcus aberystwythensis]RKH68242.1 carboxypeptidase regulatory-like domain-containing protein [Corallococcus aberystwythensis]
MRVKRILGGLLVAVLLGVGAWMLLRSAPVPPPMPSPVATWIEDAGVPEVSPPVETAGVPDAGLWLTATLEGSRPFEGEARVGAAFISDSDRGWWEEEGRQRIARTGPARLEDLANVREWVEAPVTASAQGGVVGPVEVPSAPRYQVMAFSPDGTVWWGDHVPATQPVTGRVDLGRLREHPPTGIRLRLDGARDIPGTFSVRMQRVADPETVDAVSRLLPVLALAAPGLMHAFENDTPVPLVKDGETRLAPLPPDRSLRLWLRTPSGKQSEPVEVSMREGSIAQVTLDVARMFPEGLGETVTLRGRVLLGDGTRPLGTAVYRRGDGEELPLALDGRFTIPDVPAWTETRFTVRREVAEEEGRPQGPLWWDFVFTPTAESRGTVDVVWRMPVYRWLVLRMDGFTRAQLREHSEPPYPVYLLERRDARGDWIIVPTREFRPEGDNLAVSLTEPGTYRIQVASSPYASRPSSTARVGEDFAEVETRLSPEDAAVSACEVRVTREGQPVAGAMVIAGGGIPSLPPVRGDTDSAGRWRMGPVTSSALPLQVHGGDAMDWEGDGAEACRRSGVVEVRL